MSRLPINFEGLQAAMLSAASINRRNGVQLASRGHADTAETCHARADALELIANHDDSLDFIRSAYEDARDASREPQSLRDGDLVSHIAKRDTPESVWNGAEMRATVTTHGYPILQRKPSSIKGSAIVLAFRANHPDDPFAIWRMDDQGNCEGGQYIADIARAAVAFAERA